MSLQGTAGTSHGTNEAGKPRARRAAVQHQGAATAPTTTVPIRTHTSFRLARSTLSAPTACSSHRGADEVSASARGSGEVLCSSKVQQRHCTKPTTVNLHELAGLRHRPPLIPLPPDGKEKVCILGIDAASVVADLLLRDCGLYRWLQGGLGGTAV
jgi:hypothetical protein